MKFRRFIELKNHKGYYYSVDHLSITRGKEDKAFMLFDLYWLFKNDSDYSKFPINERLEIAEKLVYAYKKGIEDENARIKEKLNKFLF